MKAVLIAVIGGSLCLVLVWVFAHKGVPVICSFDSGRESSGFIYALDNEVSILKVEKSLFYINTSEGVLGSGDTKVIPLLGNYALINKGNMPPAIYLFNICIEEGERGFSITNMGKKIKEYDIDGVEMVYSEVPIRIEYERAQD